MSLVGDVVGDVADLHHGAPTVLGCLVGVAGLFDREDVSKTGILSDTRWK